MAKVCVFFADGFEEVEGLTVVDLLRRAGHEVVMVSIYDRWMVSGAHHIEVKADVCIADMDFANADMLVLPGGGSGTEALGSCPALTALLRDFAAKGRLLAAICAAPSILGDLGLLKGKRAVCYPGFESRLTDAIVTKERVVTDGNIITGRSAGTAISFTLELIAQLENQEAADKIKESILYGH